MPHRDVSQNLEWWCSSKALTFQKGTDLRKMQVLMPSGCLQEWGSCRGSRETSRGYTCGLWLLLHSLAARSAPPETVGAFWMAAVK